MVLAVIKRPIREVDLMHLLLGLLFIPTSDHTALNQLFNHGCHLHQDLIRLPGEVLRIERLLVADRPEELVLVTAVEGRLPHEHLVQEDPERPPVNAVRILQALDDL